MNKVGNCFQDLNISPPCKHLAVRNGLAVQMMSVPLSKSRANKLKLINFWQH